MARTKRQAKLAHNDELSIVDDLGEDIEDTLPDTYSISSYGVDYPVDSLVKRMDSGDIVIPPFQRAYVWTLKQASRFIESLLLGLPVPAVFFSKEPDTGRLLVIDGQQRLRTVQYFVQGIFPSKDGEAGREFRLTGVMKKYHGLTWKSLSPEQRRNIDNTIIHAIVFKQDSPAHGNSSVYHVFERLNTGGTQLKPQEIRASIFYGEFQKALRALNTNENWRAIYGPPSVNMRDEELILRFIALYFDGAEYKEPMKQFLNSYMSENRHLQVQSEEALRGAWEPSINFIHTRLGEDAFKPQRLLNAAVFDAVMVGVATRLAREPIIDGEAFDEAYRDLVESADFLEATSKSTASVERVRRRLQLATDAFADVP